MRPAADYPARWETHAVLRDGSTVEIRPIRPDDRAALTRFHDQQSPESIYFRYFRYRPTLTEADLDHLTQIDYRDRMAFVAMLGPDLIAVARYESLSERPVAEVAFFVHDDHHGKGLATLMLEYLAAAARDRGLGGLTATVLPENYRMLGVFRGAGFEVSTRFADGVIDVDLGIEVTSESSSAMADRHRLAAARSVARIVEARTVAVIGASRKPGTVGHELVRQLRFGPTGGASVGIDGAGTDRSDGAEVYRSDGAEIERSDGAEVDRSDEAEVDRSGGAETDRAEVLVVNPAAEEILGLACHPSIAAASEAATGDRIDLAIVAVRAELVVDVVRQCAEAGVGGLLIISAGFSELDDEGADREREVVELARDNGMRLLGPAAFGLINTGHPVELWAVYHPVPARPGRVAVASQSGPLGAAVLDSLRQEDVGVSSFVGVGNRADVSVNDLLDYWSLDPSTDAIVLYVENVGNLRNFSTTARRTSLTKPIITIRPSSPDQVELSRQAGVILVDEVSQLVEQVELAATQPSARGNRVALISNSASVASLAASACRRHGLQLVVPAGVGGAARDDSVLIGDLDSIALRPSGEGADYERVVVAAAVSDEIDLVLMALAPTAYFDRRSLEQLLDRVNRAIDKPMAAVGLLGPDRVRVEGLPVFAFPEGAARVLGRHARYGLWRAAQQESESNPAGESEGESEGEPATAGDVAVDRLIDRLLAGGREALVTMSSPDLPALVDALGIPVAPWGAASGADEAATLAESIGYPVVLKAANLATRSLGEWGGTAIDLHDRAALEAAHRRMTAGLGVAMRTAIVQRMIPSHGAIRLELLQDRAFGAMVSVGRGGSAYQTTVPVARRFLPLDRSEAQALVRDMAEVEGEWAVGRPALEAVVDLIERLVRAAAAGERVARITLNPVLLSGTRAVPTDVEVVLRSQQDDPLREVRHL